jgi:hypothetical protein
MVNHALAELAGCAGDEDRFTHEGIFLLLD